MGHMSRTDKRLINDNYLKAEGEGIGLVKFVATSGIQLLARLWYDKD